MKKHYVYRITNKIENKHYYGVRSSLIEPKDDLGIKYFSSSTDKKFIKEQKENPDNYKYKVIKIFSTREEAMSFEIHLHNKFNVHINENFYNRAKQTSIGFNAIPDEETRRKLSLAHTGKKLTKEHKANISIGSLGVKKSENMKNKLSKTRKGMIYINNGEIEKIIKPTVLHLYVYDNWKEGKLPMTNEMKKSISNASFGKPGTTTGKIYINKNNVEKLILKEDLEKYLNNGWIKGRIKLSEEAKQKLKGRKGSTSGKIGINNTKVNKFVVEEDLEKYLNDGWIKGLKSNKKSH